jgi:hypothetical protein
MDTTCDKFLSLLPFLNVYISVGVHEILYIIFQGNVLRRPMGKIQYVPTGGGLVLINYVFADPSNILIEI